MLPQGGNRIEDEVPAVNWRNVFYCMIAILVIWAGYAAIEASRHAGYFEAAGPQETAELFVREHMRYELMEQGILHFHGPKETQVEKIANDQYRVTGTVDVIQPSGAARENHYYCTIRLLSSGEWAAEKIYVLPTS
jgi:hypothetical protein